MIRHTEKWKKHKQYILDSHLWCFLSLLFWDIYFTLPQPAPPASDLVVDLLCFYVSTTTTLPIHSQTKYEFPYSQIMYGYTMNVARYLSQAFVSTQGRGSRYSYCGCIAFSSIQAAVGGETYRAERQEALSVGLQHLTFTVVQLLKLRWKLMANSIEIYTSICLPLGCHWVG